MTFSRSSTVYPCDETDYPLVIQPPSEFHDRLSTDMFRKVITFLTDKDLMEILYTDRIIMTEICKTRRPIGRYACPVCHHSVKECGCARRGQWISCAYLLFMAGLCAFCFLYVLAPKGA